MKRFKISSNTPLPSQFLVPGVQNPAEGLDLFNKTIDTRLRKEMKKSQGSNEISSGRKNIVYGKNEEVVQSLKAPSNPHLLANGPLGVFLLLFIPKGVLIKLSIFQNSAGLKNDIFQI